MSLYHEMYINIKLHGTTTRYHEMTTLYEYIL